MNLDLVSLFGKGGIALALLGIVGYVVKQLFSSLRLGLNHVSHLVENTAQMDGKLNSIQDAIKEMTAEMREHRRTELEILKATLSKGKPAA